MKLTRFDRNTMTPERWQKIERAFHSVLAGARNDRSSLLDSVCGDDPELRREVELLLEAEAQSGSFLASAKLPRQPDDWSEEAPCAVGRVIGQYQVVAAIGAGAMGEVYLARDTRLHRHVALKLLPAEFARDRERVSRFMREARAASGLNHPNIVTVHDGGEVQGAWFIATEFIDGLTLRQRLAVGRLPVTDALEIALQCAAALEAAHGAGVCHRDIKPENIMLRPDGLVKIVDFGLARIALCDPGATETQVGAVLGTPRYMSPEQARGERSDALSDVFSLGAVLYEMTVGRPAFAGATSADVLASLLTSNPEQPSADSPDLPKELDRIVAKALAKQRSGRYATMREFAADLRRLKQRLENPQPARRGRTRFGIAAAAAVALISPVWIWRSARDTTLKPIPLTAFAGAKDYPALSPDGRRLAFSWNGGQGGVGGRQERNLYVKAVDAGEPVRLTNSEEDNIWASWSPDGRQIAFGRRLREGGCAIFVVPADGGPERRIAEGGSGVSWSPDGSTLALARRPPPFGSGGIYLLNLRTGQQRELTRPEPDFDDLPAFSPDGRWVAFSRGETEHLRGVWLAPVQGGVAKALTFGEKGLAGVTWTADSREILFASLRGGSENIWRVPITGSVPERIGLPPEDSYRPAIPSIGGVLAYTVQFTDTNLYRAESAGVDAGESIRFTPDRLVIRSAREDHSPNFSPDGEWLAFVSTRGGGPDIWISRRDGREVSRLTDLKSASVGSPRWSPDGRWIAFDGRNDGAPDIYVMGPDGGSLHRLTTEAAADNLPSWSTDAEWIYFASDRSGASKLWKARASGGPAVQITRGGARESWPSPDGKLIYYTKSRESAIWSVPVNGGPEQPVAELQEFDRIGRSWGVVPGGIYFVSRHDGPPQEIRFYSFATRRVTVLTTLARELILNLPAIALSPDGRDLMIAHVDREVNDLMMVRNFR